MKLALGDEAEMSMSEFESRLSKDNVLLVRIALGSLNEPAYTAWISMTEYALSRGEKIFTMVCLCGCPLCVLGTNTQNSHKRNSLCNV